MKIYLAASFLPERRPDIEKAKDILRGQGHKVYNPVENFIPNAWDYPNDEWGLMVFAEDIKAIQNAEAVVLLTYGRMGTAGSNWEAGFAYGIGKKVIVVEMTDEIMSLMVANGRYATVKGLEGLATYDWENMPKTRTKTEQK
jgi:nucleoside deoxyribosyltransferase